MDCRGKQMREQIVQMYDLELIIYSVILKGKEKTSCTGQTLTDTYYQFLCKSKINDKESKIITCGYVAGEHFLELSNIERPKIFNPLVNYQVEHEENINNEEKNEPNRRNKEQWNVLAKELYIALNWLSICWNKPLTGHLLEKLINIRENPTKEPDKQIIIAINTSISKSRGNQSLTEMINELRKDNEIREYSFPYLNEYINKVRETDKKRKDIKSFF